MYNQYFGFTRSPFENNLDLRFFYLGEAHREVVAALLYFISEGKGFAFVCGDVGTGKTTIINYFLDELPFSVQPIVVSNPDVEYSQLLRYIARKVGVDGEGMDSLDLSDQLQAALEVAANAGQRFVLVVDEAHLLSEQSLEGVRLLSNFETREHKLLQILLVGQYELSHKLDSPNMRQLRQRININRFLSPMDISETMAYIDHRLQVAGAGLTHCFEPGCSKLIYSLTGGVPRKINLLCDHALLICQAKGLPRIDRTVLRQARNVLYSDRLLAPAKIAGRGLGLRKFMAKLFLLGPWLLVLVLAGIFFRGAVGIGLRPNPTGTAGAGTSAIHNEHKQSGVFPGVPGNERGKQASIVSKPQNQPAGAADRRERVVSRQREATAIKQASLAATGEELSSSKSPSHGRANKALENAMPPEGNSLYPRDRIVERDVDTSSPAVPIATAPQSNVDSAVGPGTHDGVPGAAASQIRHSSEILAEKDGKTLPGPVMRGAVDQAPAPEPSLEKTRNMPEANPSPPGPVSATVVKRIDMTGADTRQLERNSAFRKTTKVVERGDTLMKIAMQWYPYDPERGLIAILEANPTIRDQDLIYPGQILTLPQLDSPTGLPLGR